MSDQPIIDSIDFQSFVKRLREGEPVAVKKLFDDYSRRLTQLAGKNIHAAMLKRFEGEDVVQSVFRTFFGAKKQASFMSSVRSSCGNY